MIWKQRNLANEHSEDATSDEFVSGDMVQVELTPQWEAGSELALGSPEASRTEVDEVSGSQLQILVAEPVGEEARLSPLVLEMIEAWRGGNFLATEDLLDRHPDLCDDAEAVARLILEEIRLR